MQIGEVAASAARDQDLAPGLGVMFQHHHAASALPGLNGAHQSGCARADYQNVYRVRRQRYLWQQIWLEISAGTLCAGVASAK